MHGGCLEVIKLPCWCKADLSLKNKLGSTPPYHSNELLDRIITKKKRNTHTLIYRGQGRGWEGLGLPGWRWPQPQPLPPQYITSTLHIQPPDTMEASVGCFGMDRLMVRGFLPPLGPRCTAAFQEGTSSLQQWGSPVREGRCQGHGKCCLCGIRKALLSSVIDAVMTH